MESLPYVLLAVRAIDGFPRIFAYGDAADLVEVLGDGAELHNADVSLRPNPKERGAIARVVFPAFQPEDAPSETEEPADRPQLQRVLPACSFRS